jgi:hypothetical protein
LARSTFGARAFSLAMRIRDVTRYYGDIHEFTAVAATVYICEYFGL